MTHHYHSQIFSLLFFGAFFVACAALLFFSAPQKTFAGTEHSVSGWMWGGSESGDATEGVIDGDETGVGWISMNSTNCDTDDDGQSNGASGCPSSGTPIANYGVDIPDNNGLLSGYGWSENLGWITFNTGELNGCPQAPCNARREVNDTLRGWARVISIEAAGSNAGDYDGWIKLGSNGEDTIKYGGEISGSGPADVTGYAWSDEFGWIQFEDVEFDDITLDVVLCPTTAILRQGGTFQLTAYYSDTTLFTCTDVSAATDVTDSATWISDVPATATVDDGANKGLVSGIAQGGPIAVRATYSGEESQSLISVNSTASSCGDGTVDSGAGEECDDGATGNGSCSAGLACSPYCRKNVCVSQCSGP